jgi:hypothetical protein
MARPKRLSQSAQARWARRKVRAGRCRICGEKRNHYASLCDKHQKTFTLYMRAWRAKRKQQEQPDGTTNAPLSPTPTEGTNP